MFIVVCEKPRSNVFLLPELELSELSYSDLLTAFYSLFFTQQWYIGVLLKKLVCIRGKTHCRLVS